MYREPGERYTTQNGSTAAADAFTQPPAAACPTLIQVSSRGASAKRGGAMALPHHMCYY